MAKFLYLTFSVLLAFNIQSVKSWAPLSRGSKTIASLKHHRLKTVLASAAASAIPAPNELSEQELLARQARQEGGPLTFKTKYGYLNPYGLWYGLTSIAIGIFWYAAMWLCQILYILTGNRVDQRRRLVTLASQMWGESMMFVAQIRPKIEGWDKLKEYFKDGKGKSPSAMIVANHNSWLDIPFLGTLFGWNYNYKLVSKVELGKVPVLGKAIKLGRHVMLDRSSRKSQILTLRKGMDLLKNGVYLCTFPEGTRSKSGRILPFKNGAFKMAHKVGAPVIPVSIEGSGKAMPPHWMMPYRPASKVAKIVIHDPIPSDDKTEAELASAVRAKIIEGLPEDQHPLPGDQDFA